MSALIALDHVSVTFDLGGGGFLGGKKRTLQAVADVSFEIEQGEVLALVGESGSGKSTIGNVVAGLREPTDGTIKFRGKRLDAAGEKLARRSIQIVFQDPFGALDPRMPVSSIITEPLLIQKIGTRRRAASGRRSWCSRSGCPWTR